MRDIFGVEWKCPNNRKFCALAPRVVNVQIESDLRCKILMDQPVDAPSSLQEVLEVFLPQLVSRVARHQRPELPEGGTLVLDSRNHGKVGPGLQFNRHFWLSLSIFGVLRHVYTYNSLVLKFSPKFSKPILNHKCQLNCLFNSSSTVSKSAASDGIFLKVPSGVLPCLSRQRMAFGWEATKVLGCNPIDI